MINEEGKVVASGNAEEDDKPDGEEAEFANDNCHSNQVHKSTES